MNTIWCTHQFCPRTFPTHPTPTSCLLTLSPSPTLSPAATSILFGGGPAPPLSGACAVVSQEALPGIFKMAEHVYFTGSSWTAPNGDKMVHGQQGEVVGPARGSLVGRGLEIRFPGNKGNVGCLLTKLSRSPPVPSVWSATS